MSNEDSIPTSIEEVLRGKEDLLDLHKRSVSSIRVKLDRLYENEVNGEKIITVVCECELVNQQRWCNNSGIIDSIEAGTKRPSTLMKIAKNLAIRNSIQLAHDSNHYEYLKKNNKDW